MSARFLYFVHHEDGNVSDDQNLYCPDLHTILFKVHHVPNREHVEQDIEVICDKNVSINSKREKMLNFLNSQDVNGVLFQKFDDDSRDALQKIERMIRFEKSRDRLLSKLNSKFPAEIDIIQIKDNLCC
ncbi:hypothetical protein RF11_08325 [Thelohanellus kitauei]|uniref:Uncharacterized protein n=1 Tax=Thelohanellus kitauei TaxID=669202 RepID=A0A0C2IYA9_THEKT|nr:hypothetical protein RF11_08325 [Thelohanellus kitauei]